MAQVGRRVPLREGKTELADEYRKNLLQSPGMTTVPLDESIAEAAAGLRARYHVRTPDAIQLATAHRVRDILPVSVWYPHGVDR